MACGSECLSIGPPPDWILHIPPPPLPLFMMLGNLTPPCGAPLCSQPDDLEENMLFPGVEYHELPRHAYPESVSAEDSWLPVMITCCIAVLCLAALLALFLFKWKEVRAGCKSKKGKAGGPNSLYGGGIDSRVLWAALTPRGTRHFVADTYPHDDTDENHYECVDPPLYKLAPPDDLTIARHFTVQYEDPALLIENYDRSAEDYYSLAYPPGRS